MLRRKYSIGITIMVSSILILGLYPYGQAGNNLSSTLKQELQNNPHDNSPLDFGIDSAYAIPVNAIPKMVQDGRHVVEVNLIAMSVDLPIMGGGTYHAMTFNGQVPGPIIRATQGDIIKVTLTVPSSEPTPHGIDMHASQTTASNFGAVKPGDTMTYAYIADVPGTFKYHCSGVNVAAMDQHVFSGMYGLTIVDPVNGYKPLTVDKTYVENGTVTVKHQRYEADAKEFVLEYNQLYLNADGSYDQTAMFLHNTTQTVVNGFAFGYVPNADINKLIKGDASKNIFVAQPWNSADLKQYQSHPLFVDTGVHYRIFVENQGNMPVFFHIVGEIIDRVVQANHVQAQGTETWLVGGSQGAIMDLVFDNPGVYVAVNHDYAAIFTGAASVFVAGDPFNLGYHPGDMPNPSDAVPPMGKNSIPQKTVCHSLTIYENCKPSPAKIKLDSYTYQPNSDATIKVTFPGAAPPTSQVDISSDHESGVKTFVIQSSGLDSLTGQVHLSANCDPTDPTCFKVNLHDTISAIFHDPTNVDIVTTALIIDHQQVPQIWFDKDQYAMGTGAAIFVYDSTPNTNSDTQRIINVQITNDTNPSNKQQIKLKEIPNPITEKFDTNTYTNDFAVMFAFTSDPTMPSLGVSIGNTITASYPIATSNAVTTTAHIVNETALESAAGLGGSAKISSFRQTWPIAKTMTCGLYGGDTDSDGICNYWEDSTHNGGNCLKISMPSPFPSYTYNGCTTGSNPIDTLAATTTQKDVYVWIDSVPNNIPSTNKSFVNVTTVFSSIDLGSSSYSPKLHVLVNHNAYTVNLPYNATSGSGLAIPVGFNNIKHVNFDNPNKNNAHVAMAQVFHYGLLANTVGLVTQDDGTQVQDSGSSGYGEILGNDFIITLGSFPGGVVNKTDLIHADYNDHFLAGTFMHELGHNLNLLHGGSDSINCKPNYLSVMSYSRQFDSEFPWPARTVPAFYGISQTLNYSGEPLTSINEQGPLPSMLGPVNGKDRNTVWGPPYHMSNALTQVGSTTFTWNIAGNTGPLNVDNLVTPSGNNPSNYPVCSDTTHTENLVGHTDWNALNLLFRGSSNFDAGFKRSVTSPGSEMDYGTYKSILSNTLEGVKQSIEDYKNNIDSDNYAKILTIVDDTITSVGDDNFTKANDDFKQLDNICHTLITDPKAIGPLCDDLIPRESYALSLTVPESSAPNPVNSTNVNQ